MALHLIKMAVGVSDFADLKRLQKLRRKERGCYCFFTRNMPRRVEEVLDGGSIFWVIKGYVQARQGLLGFTPVTGEEGERYCAVEYDKDLVPVVWQPKRPFQGWRYLEPKDAPLDRPANTAAGDDLPATMAQELRALGLL
jgi:hypothetical protein